MDSKHYPEACYNKDGSLIDPGPGYRLLELAEPLENGDSKYVEGEWREFHEMDLGAPVWRLDPPIRRKVKEVQELPKDTIKDTIKELQSKLDQANGIILDLLSVVQTVKHIQADTGLPTERCREIFEYYQELLKARG